MDANMWSGNEAKHDHDKSSLLQPCSQARVQLSVTK